MTAAIFGTALLSGCDTAVPLFVRTEEPMLYLVLSADPPVAPDAAQSAILATTGVPTSLEFRTADEFALYRVADNAAFVFRNRVPAPPRQGNYELPELADAEGLGRTNLQPGQTYRLRVITHGREITGTVTIPLRPILRVEADGIERRLIWNKVAGSSTYLVNGINVNNGLQSTTDTFVVLPHIAAGNDNLARITISAIDSNYASSLRDGAIIAGVRGAYGILGARSSSEIIVILETR
ncbi:MAG: hypothetical protein ABI852_05440 [Gemmatimonadaceae bacterium]